MAWQQLNLQDAKINMSKVVPFDSTLATLDKKQAYYHNNRLTALQKYTTDNAVGYKCYKRQANASNLVDGELTDYIEINKVTESGSIEHMLDIADKYFKSEVFTVESSSKNIDFLLGYILDDTYIGDSSDWLNCTFYKLLDHTYLIDDSTSSSYKVLITKQTKYSNASLNYELTTFSAEKSSTVLINEDGKYYLFYKDFFEEAVQIINNFSNKTYKWNTHYSDWTNRLTDKTYTNLIIQQGSVKSSISTVLITAYNRDTMGWDNVSAYININPCNDTSENVLSFFKFHITLTTYYLLTGWEEWSGTISDKTISVSAAINPDGATDYRNVDSSVNNPAHFSYTDIFNTNISIDNTTWIVTKITGESKDKTMFSDWNGSKSSAISLESTSMTTVNKSNDTLLLNNGFVLNYENKVPVTLGYNYKVVARLDTQGSSYVNSDDNYVYVKQNDVIYKISIDSMYPNKNYDEEVNIIESDYCKKVGGYKIFNTTTYYNAIYNDDSDHVICSCDDWNGRFSITSESSTGDKVLATSRVGNFWDNDSTHIPCKTISSEENDFYIYLNSDNKFNWCNSAYTIHENTTAFFYYPDSILSDTKIQQYKITSAGFTVSRDDTKIFSHNSLYQLVPSILFCSFLKSDVINVIQIGSEAYELLNYAYSQATPALVYQEEAISINVDPTSQEMVIQGAYYTIGGASDSRKILNPYDTSTSTYCCDVTGLRYLGYDSTQGYFYSPATGVIYTFNGANKLNAYLEVDKRIPLESGVVGDDTVGIEVTNIPSMNIVAMAFTDGVLIICNGQSVFIECQSVNSMEASKEYGLIKINGSYYYFGTNNTIQGLVEDAKKVTVDFNLKSARIGFNRLTNQTCQKHRLVIYTDSLNDTTKATATVTLTGVLGNKSFSETYTKTITAKELLGNEYQWEFNPKNTKSTYFQTEVTLTNADLLEYWMDINETAEENLVRK